MRISSPDNPLVRRLRRLAESPRACREAGRTLAEGIHLLECVLQSGVPVVTLVVRGVPGPAAVALADRIEAAAGAGFRRIELPPALYDAIAPVEHGAGVLVEIAIPDAPAELPDGVDAVYLDGVQDPGNVGTLLRTAAAAGVRHAVVGAGSAHAWSPKALRAGMGAHFALRIAEDAAVADVAGRFRGEVLAADVQGDDLYAAEWGAGPTLWLFGSEGQGLGPQARAAARLKLRIPLAPAVESLNVAAAAAVCLFEQVRRRNARADAGRASRP